MGRLLRVRGYHCTCRTCPWERKVRGVHRTSDPSSFPYLCVEEETSLADEAPVLLVVEDVPRGKLPEVDLEPQRPLLRVLSY